MKSYIDFSYEKNHASINGSLVKTVQPEAAVSGNAVSNELIIDCGYGLKENVRKLSS